MDTPMRELLLPDGRTAILRPGVVRDAEGLRALHRAVASDGRGMVGTVDDVGSAAQWQQRLGREPRQGSLALVAEVGGTVAGTAQLTRFEPGLVNHVGVLAVEVHPSFQRQGIASALLDMLITHARRHGLVRLELYVRADNHRALSLYRKLGFAQEGVRRRFVRLPDGSYVDDLIMARLLDVPSVEPSGGDRLTDFRDFVREFVAERRWEPYHDPKNLAMAVASEAGELCAELRWVQSAEADRWAADPDNRSRLADEIADVGITLLMLADRVGLDLVDAMRAKMEKNRRKYPPPEL